MNGERVTGSKRLYHNDVITFGKCKSFLPNLIKARMNSNSLAHRMVSQRSSVPQLLSAQTSKTHLSLDSTSSMMLRDMREMITFLALGTTNTLWLRSNNVKGRKISWLPKKKLVSTSNMNIKHNLKTRRRQESLVRKKWRFRTSSLKNVESFRNATKQKSINS